MNALGTSRPIEALLSTQVPPRSGARWGLATAAAFLFHLPLWIWSSIVEPTIETWSAELAAKVHAELSREDIVELVAPPPSPPPPPPPVVPAAEPPPPVATPEPTAAAARPKAAAASTALTAREDAPLDLTADALVTGTAVTPGNGATASTTVTREPVPPAPAPAPEPRRAPPPAKPPAPDLAKKVALSAAEWDCPWPTQAAASPIVEQAVVIRVTVGTDGRAEKARAVTDPGHGFAAAAVACALRARFQPALDRAGKPVRAESPPIRVVFSR